MFHNMACVIYLLVSSYVYNILLYTYTYNIYYTSMIIYYNKHTGRFQKMHEFWTTVPISLLKNGTEKENIFYESPAYVPTKFQYGHHALNTNNI